ncbi:MAG: GAF domain-containing protein, partial [Polyangiales bacterium]
MADEDALRAKLERAIRQQAALLELWSVDHESFEERVRHVLRSASITLGVERVSYWSLAGAPDAIRCEALFVRADERFESGAELANSKYPKYFEALRAGRPIVATDAHTHPATSEFSDGYLKPNNIGAMLDVPVYVQGQLAGVVCHEHVGAERNWPDDELLFAMSAAQLISLADESRRRAAAELALRESEARFRSIVEASPVPMLVIGFPDGLVRYGNAAASELVGVPHDSLVGQTTIDYYANPAERAE